MSRWRWVVGAVVIAAVVGFFYWRDYASPEARVRKVADQFLTAVTAGDTATVETLLAPGALVTARQWVEQNKGLSYHPGGVHAFKFLKNDCGVEMVGLATVLSPDGIPHSRSILFQRVNGRWLVYMGEGVVTC